MRVLTAALRTRAYAGISQKIEISGTIVSNTITSVQKDCMVVEVYKI